MRDHIWRAAALTALLVGSAAVASAQQAPDELGSPRLPGWTFTPSMSIAALFDSNVALDDAPASTGQTEGDRLFLLRPSGQFEFMSPRTDFSATYSGNVRRYVEFDQLNGYDQRLNVSLRRLATRRLTLFVGNTFVDVPTTDEVEVNGVPFSRTGTRTNSLSAGLTARLTKFTDFNGRYEHTFVSFDPTNDQTFLTGGQVNAFHGDVSQRFSERIALGGEYSIRFADLNEGTRQLTFQNLGGTFRYTVGPRTSLSMAAGLARLDDRTLDESRNGPFFRSALTHQLSRAVIGAVFEKNYVPSFGFGGSTSNQELGGFIRMPIYQNRLYVQGSTTWRRSIPLNEGSLELDTIRARTTVGYFAARWLRTEGFYTYARQDSIITGGEIDRHRVGVQVVVSQPMRIR